MSVHPLVDQLNPVHDSADFCILCFMKLSVMVNIFVVGIPVVVAAAAAVVAFYCVCTCAQAWP